MLSKTNLSLCFLVSLCTFMAGANPAMAFPWSLIGKLGKAGGSIAAKSAGAAAKGGGAAKLGGAAAKIGVGKTASMTAAGAAAGDAALGGKAATSIGGAMDDVAVGGRAYAVGSLSDEGSRAAAIGSDAAADLSYGGSSQFIDDGVSVTSSTKSRIGNNATNVTEHAMEAADVADAASNIGYGEDDEDSLSDSYYETGPWWIYLFGVSALLFAAGYYLTKKGKGTRRR